ncbi:Cro/CI family transcriptional regulator [Motilimonas sp. 1_MG-2023]|uniref:Cro/CI family transcriptional regulator n=1 Tax=Motilimonas sp. 1_MG-2023 TaxID=3062672 RepID=UPI0026E17DA3|nr:Cro/CI family transcriptional regulator [Motilimonas sp. 1_MG-2023]MDO6525420.1 Cro/CI family transcriptional regulator [Motilimonas sp. 1_MG-2023]
MQKTDAIKHFGSANKLANALGITRMSITQWGDEIPPRRAFEIERITHGALKADFNPPQPNPH